MIREIILEAKLNQSTKNRIDKLYTGYVKKAKGDMGRLHIIITKSFTSNPYTRASNLEIEYIWSLYKKEGMPKHNNPNKPDKLHNKHIPNNPLSNDILNKFKHLR